MVIKDLENKIKLVGIISVVAIVACMIICISSIITASNMIKASQQNIYVMDGNVPIIVSRTTMEETKEVEAKSHIQMFHQYFFTLAPDDDYIKYTVERALALADQSAVNQYNTLKEKGFYNQIMGTSTVFSIYCDSINLNKDDLTFTYYGRQRIERRSSVLYRELVTSGQLRRTSRTNKNPHGFIITNWNTVLNRDMDQKTKNVY